MTDEQRNINRAFEEFFSLPDFSKEDSANITRELGAYTEQKAKEIYKVALNVPVDWKTWTMDAGLDAMHSFLRREYSWLSDEARSKLNYAFIMAWK